MLVNVSVIIPVYNVEQYLRQCLDSVINQTYKDIEIIIVNDCSPDNSLQIIKEYQQKDERILLVDLKESRKEQAKKYQTEGITLDYLTPEKENENENKEENENENKEENENENEKENVIESPQPNTQSDKIAEQLLKVAKIYDSKKSKKGKEEPEKKEDKDEDKIEIVEVEIEKVIEDNKDNEPEVKKEEIIEKKTIIKDVGDDNSNKEEIIEKKTIIKDDGDDVNKEEVIERKYVKKDDEKDNRFTRALLKYRRNKERKKEEDSSKKASASKVNKSERVIEIAKELEPKLSKWCQMIKKRKRKKLL